jgi:hypothetical protein
MTGWSKFPQHLLIYAVLLGVFIVTIARAFGSEQTGRAPANGNRTAKVLSVRKVLREQYFLSRYPQIHYYLLYISLSISDQTYCTEYETPVLDEIADVTLAVNQNVAVAVKGKTVLIQAPKGHKLKAHLAKRSQC